MIARQKFYAVIGLELDFRTSQWVIGLKLDLEPLTGKNDKIVLIVLESAFLKSSNHLGSDISTKL